MEHWYTLYTKPNAERLVAAALERRGIETYLPEVEAVQARKGRVRRPFFPCYLFIKVDFEKTGLSCIQWTPGLRCVVAFGDHPVPLNDEVLEFIQHKLEGINATGGYVTHTFHPGEIVQITHGPLQGLLAIFEGPSTPTHRVQVLLNFLGHASRAHISVTDLVKAPSQAPVPKRSRRTRGRGRRINHNIQVKRDGTSRRKLPI